MSAPKLTEAQREALRRLYVCGDAPLDVLTWALGRSFACRGGIHKYELTDAGISALKGGAK